jgi:acyl-CoA synthetase (NDP forming)/RimJ/RimL family protein N-acetyltransferase
MSGYPRHWETDVVLADGGTAHVRPIQPSDADRLVALHGRLSPESIRYRYFAPHPRLSQREVERFTQVDHHDRVALVAVLGDDLIAVSRYERVPGTDMAEVAFVVDDAHQRRGLAAVLLEHLAAAAAERGIRRFEADVLPDNMRMARVFTDAGYRPSRSYDEDSVHFVFPIEPTTASLAVMQSREQRAEARSIGRLLNPRSVAVVGAGRSPASVGHAVLVNLLRAGFEGPVYPVNPNTGHVASVRAYPTVGDVPGDVDLVVLAVPVPAVPDVIDQCARKGVHGLVVMSGGVSETAAAERDVVALTRGHGMRLVGPNCLGMMRTAADVRLNATLAPALPPPGRAGFFSQSGVFDAAILESIGRRGLGLSTYVSTGNQADVSGNDILQYWEDDPATDVVLLHIESFGNPRKFVRLARRLGRRKPIVAVKSGGAVAARLGGAADPERAVDALFRQAGVVRVDTLSQLFDVAQILTTQPLPAGRRVAVVGNSAALCRLTVDACAGNGLDVGPLSPADRESLGSALGPDVAVANPLVLPQDSGPAQFQTALSALLADDAVDAVVSVFVSPLREADSTVAQALSAASAGTGKPVVSTVLNFAGLPGPATADPDPGARVGGVPAFPSPEIAVAALARTAAYAEWRRRPEGTVPAFPDVDPAVARTVVTEALRASPEGVRLDTDQVRRLLGAYGVPVWPAVVVASPGEARAAAERLGYPVALKATAPAFRHRPELGTVRLDITDSDGLQAAYDAMTSRLGANAGLAVQAMAPPGVATVVRAADDPSFGALVSFGLGGVATELLGDHGFRVLPLTDLDAAELVRSVRAAPLLFGYRGSAPVDVGAVETLLLRIARLADDLPEIAELELNPVIVGRDGTSVLNAVAWVAPGAARLDTGPRRLS